MTTAPPPTIHDEALRAFVEDYEILGRLSAKSTTHEIRSACLLLRRFLDPNHVNLQTLWSQLGNPGDIRVHSVIGPSFMSTEWKASCRLHVPELRVIPAFPIRNYVVQRLPKPGEAMTVLTECFIGNVRVREFASMPYVLVEGEPFSRYEVIQFVAYEFGHAHFVMDFGRAQALRQLGKIRWPNDLIGTDTGVGWIGPQPGMGDEAAKAVFRKVTEPFDDHELTTWLLLQIAKDIIDSPNVADLCVQIRTKLLLAPPRGRSRTD